MRVWSVRSSPTSSEKSRIKFLVSDCWRASFSPARVRAWSPPDAGRFLTASVISSLLIVFVRVLTREMKSSRVKSLRLVLEAFNSARMSRATGSLVVVLLMRVWLWWWWW